MLAAWLRIIFWSAALAGGAFGVLDLTVFQTWTVPSDDPLLSASIAPTLQPGDVVLVTRHGDVARGDLLRCDDPQAPGRFVIARAIGRGGERVDLSHEVVSIDGDRTPSPRACDTPVVTVHDPRDDEDATLACSVESYGDVPFSALRDDDYPEPPTRAVVEAGRWYLVSDDRHVHLDSRDYGSLDPSTCRHIFFRLVGAAGVRDAKSRLTIIW